MTPHGLLKIGRTTDIRKRLLDHRSNFGSPLELLQVTPGPEELEEILHKAFRDIRHGRREFFTDTPELRAVIASLPRYEEFDELARMIAE